MSTLVAGAPLHDRIRLWVLKIAKAGRLKYARGEEGTFYGEFFTAGDRQACALDVRRTLRNREIASALADGQDGDVVADLGCGLGDLAAVIPRRFRRVFVDLSLPALHDAARQADALSLCVNGALPRLPLRAGSVDTVVCLEVLEHLEDDAAALAEISRVLRVGGRLIISLPREHYFPEYRGLMGHWRHYSPETMRRLLTAAGLEPVRSLRQYERFGRMYLYIYLALWAWAAIARVLTRRPVTIYSTRVPFSRSTVYGLLAPWLVRLAQSTDGGARGSMRDGTFLVALKRAGDVAIERSRSSHQHEERCQHG